MMPELKPCPFCGVTPKPLHLHNDLWEVHCEEGDACPLDVTCYGLTEERAVKKWNTRAPNRLDAEIKELGLLPLGQGYEGPTVCPCGLTIKPVGNVVPLLTSSQVVVDNPKLVEATRPDGGDSLREAKLVGALSAAIDLIENAADRLPNVHLLLSRELRATLPNLRAALAAKDGG